MDLDHLLRRSGATEDFKRDVLAFERHEQTSRVTMTRPSPRVKVLRLLAQLLDAEPTLAIERVTVDGWSGCSDFVGVIRVESGGTERAFRFVWCCQWRAQQEGWYDGFGLPDQIRAAREFGWRWFIEWKELPAGATAPLVDRFQSMRLSSVFNQTFSH